MRTAAHRGGFTLLEMLVAMTLMSVLAGSLYASLSAGFRGRATAERALDPARRAEAALRMVGADLEAAAPPTGLLAGEFLARDGRGDTGEPADVLLFHAMARDQSGAEPPGPVRRVELELAADEATGQPALVRRTTLNLLAPEEPEPLQEVLCQRVRSFDASFFDGVAWAESWDSAVAGDVLPLAVEVSLVIEAEGREDGYPLARTFALPCGRTAETGTMMMPPMEIGRR
jgi:type II secretion system protein J